MKILDGTFRADRDGDPSASVVADGEPVSPSYLKGEGLQFWNQLVPGLVKSGVAKERDTAELTGMCEWWAIWRKVMRQIQRATTKTKNRHSLIVQAAVAWDKFNQVASRFGLTPSDRAKLRIPSDKSKSGVASRKRA